MTDKPLSETQAKVLRYLARQPNGQGQIAGHGRAPELSAARALQRRGLTGSWRTGHYYLTDAGRPVAEAELEAWRAKRAQEAAR